MNVLLIVESYLSYTAKVVITANEAILGGKILPLKKSLDAVLHRTRVQHVLVYRRTDNMDVKMELGRDQWLNEVHIII